MRPSLAGGHDRAYLQSRVNEEMARAQRHGHPFSLLIFEAVPATDGVPVRRKIDRTIELLLGRLRPSDVVARAFEDMIVVLLTETDADGAKDALFRLRSRLWVSGIASWGVAMYTFPQDQPVIDTLPALNAA